MRRMRRDGLSIAEARRIALLAQGADRGADRDGATEAGRIASRVTVRRAIEKLGVLQIDSVNVLARALRLGPLDAPVSP